MPVSIDFLATAYIGLKIPRPRGRAGSNPASGTNSLAVAGAEGVISAGAPLA